MVGYHSFSLLRMFYEYTDGDRKFLAQKMYEMEHMISIFLLHKIFLMWATMRIQLKQIIGEDDYTDAFIFYLDWLTTSYFHIFSFIQHSVPLLQMVIPFLHILAMKYIDNWIFLNVLHSTMLSQHKFMDFKSSDSFFLDCVLT